MDDKNMPNPQSNKEPAEGSRETVTDEGEHEQGGGITNRPLEREEEEQAQVPPRGQRKDEASGQAGTDRWSQHVER